MAAKSHTRREHKEFKEYSSSGNVPYTDEQFDMLKTELIPKGSKLESFGNGPGAREYHYEYKEEKHPSGKYDRKDLHTVEQYTIPPKKAPKSSESNSYYYEREERELPAITSGTRTYNYESSTSATPGYTKVKSSKVTKDLSQNVEELDSLLDDLQKDQERQLYKSGYTSDTAESTSFDYKRATPAKAPSSGYSTLKREERLESSSWGSSPPPRTTELRQELYREETTGTRGRRSELADRSWSASPPPPARRELRQDLFREEITEARSIPAPPAPAPLAPACIQCHPAPGGTLPRGGAPMNKVTTTVKTYTYEVPAGQDPTTVPLPHHCHHTTSDNITLNTTSTLNRAASPNGCQYCSHCNSHVRDVREYRTATTDDERVLYPAPANRTQLLEPRNQGPGGTYKYSETSYSAQNTTQRYPPSPGVGSHGPSPVPIRLEASPAPFPRPTTPSPGTQQPPKKLDDLLADFPEARFPTQPDGLYRRKEVSHESYSSNSAAAGPPAAPAAPAPAPAKPSSRNVAGPAVYYPPGHTPFTKKPEAQVAGYQTSAAQSGGGAYASGRGMYEYESGARSKEKHSERKTAVPICLPLCCAMPCVIM